MSFIDVKNMGKRYESGGVPVDALGGVSLQVEAGEFLAVVGESGAGKSTLLSLLGGLDRPAQGVVQLHLELGVARGPVLDGDAHRGRRVVEPHGAVGHPERAQVAVQHGEVALHQEAVEDQRVV